jgi:hypothetical protein
MCHLGVWQHAMLAVFFWGHLTQSDELTLFWVRDWQSHMAFNVKKGGPEKGAKIFLSGPVCVCLMNSNAKDQGITVCASKMNGGFA